MRNRFQEGTGTTELGQLMRGKAPTGGSHDLELTERDFDPGVGAHGTDRDKMSPGSFAGPHRSFPIKVQKDVADAMRLAGHAANPAAVRAKIARIAKAKGLTPPSKESQGWNDHDGQQESAVPVKFGRERFTESYQ